jgi:TRAP-type mannitol/chloroaromatic compound transport system substrate-binding protein
MPRPVMEAAFKASQELYSELSAKNQNWRRIYEDWSKFRADQVLWFRITEREFDNFMAAQRLSGEPAAAAAPKGAPAKKQ